ncbi:MAG: TetR/AcrR family transcriptional regulator [Deltaproteobacteria bacterium]|nr:TetR/AcrR family transcriptional regulator [Nannocystaceae bacterium]
MARGGTEIKRSSGGVTPARSRAATRTAARLDLRREMIECAAKILGDEGIGALSVRRVAAEVGASTMVVYTHFVDKDGLVDAAVAEAFERFATALSSVQLGDPAAHLRALGRSYRAFALRNPAWYRLLFWRSGDGRAMPPASARAFDTLSRAIGRILADFDRPAKDIEPAALNVWATTHGLVSLELSGAIPSEQADAAFERMLDFVDAGLRGG